MGQVYIGRITEVNNIENADRIESLTVICGEGETRQSEQGFNYRIIEIERMTCIWYDGYKEAALTCNWDEWGE